MLKFLEQRAIALRSANFEKADKIEKEMTEHKNIPENFDKIMRPNCAYVTFRNDTAFQKIIELSEKQENSLHYRDVQIKVKRALQPTNILWENFEFTSK